MEIPVIHLNCTHVVYVKKCCASLVSVQFIAHVHFEILSYHDYPAFYCKDSKNNKGANCVEPNKILYHLAVVKQSPSALAQKGGIL